jgi:hypothetical protein
MRRRWLLFAVILTAPSGCDNVTWGGTEVRLQAPPERAPALTSEGGEAGDDARPLPPLPSGAILLAGTHEGDSARLVTVAALGPDGPAPLTDEIAAPGFIEHLAQVRFPVGKELILFADGARVGRLTLTGTSVDQRYCTPRLSVHGIVELVPAATGARRLLALADTSAAKRPYTPYRHREDDNDDRAAALAMGGKALPEVGAPWPPSLLESRADVQVFHLPESDEPWIATTFLYNDQLAIGEAGERGYALFVMGTQVEGRYEPLFTWYRRAEDGKGAPRYFDHLDWDGNGTSDVLLDVLGTETRWFAGVSKRGDRWVRSYEDPCGASTG